MTMTAERPQYLTIVNAAKELGVGRGSMYYYIHVLKIKPKKFPLDRKTYITRDDLNKIVAAKQAAQEGRH